MSQLVLSLVLLAPAAEPTPDEVFQKRIQPIFNSPNPSSCVQCHLAGVDLKQYIRPTHRETFLSLRDLGMIDLDNPEKSRILGLIDRGKDDKGAKLIHKENRAAEYAAFAAWIKASAADPALRNAPKLEADKLAKPPKPVEVIRHARSDRLVESFENTVWAMRFRCMSCHIEGSTENKKLAAEYGPKVSWFKSAGPEATLKALMESKLIDAKNPTESLLLKKPLNVVKHQGGQKFLPGDLGYKAFRSFLEDYAKIVNDGYANADELPKPGSMEYFGTDIWFKIEKTPPAWGDKLMMAQLFAWDASKNTWEAEPIAATDRKVFAAGKLWQHSLTLSAPKGSDRAKGWQKGPAKLPPGRYLVKVFVDSGNKVGMDWTAELGPSDFVGQAEIRSDWPAGYGRMTALDATRVKKD